MKDEEVLGWSPITGEGVPGEPEAGRWFTVVSEVVGDEVVSSLLVCFLVEPDGSGGYNVTVDQVTGADESVNTVGDTLADEAAEDLELLLEGDDTELVDLWSAGFYKIRWPSSPDDLG